MPQNPKANQVDGHPDLEARHPNGVPRTIHHHDEETGAPVYLDEVGGHTSEDLKQFGYTEEEIAEMKTADKDATKKAKGKGTRE